MKKQHILIIDNYDSFTWNLQHYVEELLDQSCDVLRNDELDLAAINKYDGLILSPGPGLPEDAGQLLSVIKEYHRAKKILGVCLGHQALGIATGASLKQLQTVMHGRQRICIKITEEDLLLKNISSPFSAGRYHSWIIDRATLNDEWIITSEDEEKEIMSMQHKKYALSGLQFHPESIMTPEGKMMLSNWLNL